MKYMDTDYYSATEAHTLERARVNKFLILAEENLIFTISYRPLEIIKYSHILMPFTFTFLTTDFQSLLFRDMKFLKPEKTGVP